MNIRLNGEPRALPDGLTVADVLRELGYDAARLAVALNREFVPRGEYDAARLHDGDDLEVVRPMQGG